MSALARWRRELAAAWVGHISATNIGFRHFFGFPVVLAGADARR
jgi:hypothetical protein